MHNFLKTTWGATLVGIAGLAASALLPGHAQDALANGRARTAAVNAGPLVYNPEHESIVRISAHDRLPQTRGIKLGRNKAVVVELPRDLRDVVVSAPEIMDAVVQNANRVHLIGKKTGQSNAFFFDTNGQQILTLEVVIEYDTGALNSLLARLLPGSNIKSEILNETVILTGSVRNPVDATRAADIASRFIVTPEPSQPTRHPMKVINMLAVDGEEQVMLRVTVAEVQRSLLKQFGVNIGAAINAGNTNFFQHLSQ
jgi:pilus assembly protein CpaC